MLRKVIGFLSLGVFVLSLLGCGSAKTVEDAISKADEVVNEMNSRNYNGYDYESIYLEGEKIYGVRMTAEKYASSDDYNQLFIYDSTVSGATLPELTDDQSKYIKNIYGSFDNFEDVKVVFVVLYKDNMVKAAVVDGKEVFYSGANDAVMSSEGDDDFIMFAEE